MTHLSDGERRNAKRSPGEVPAAPAPKPFLPPNSTVITPQQMGLLPFISAAHVNLRAHRSVHTHTHTHTHQQPSHVVTHAHTYAQRCAPFRHLSQTRQAQTCTSHTHTHCLHPLAHSTLFLFRSDNHVQGQYQQSTGISSYNNITDTVRLRTGRVPSSISPPVIVLFPGFS